MTALISTLKSRLSNRPDTEVEQAVIRLVVGAILTVYLLAMPQGEWHWLYLPVLAAFQLAAWAVFAWIVLMPRVSPARRVLANFVDVATTTYFLSVTQLAGVPMLLVYVWVTVGNGFRYGAPYLVSSLAFSVVGFSIVLAISPFWLSHPAVGLALLAGMMALCLYVLQLVRRLSQALTRAEDANLAKRQFVSVVSHELRTPLNAILGMTDLLRDTALSREQREMVETARESGRVMAELVDDVLDFSRIEAGKLALAPVDFDLYAAVNSAASILMPHAAAKRLEFKVSIMPDVPPAVHGDSGRLKQILINLLANAVKFTEEGGVALHVSLLRENQRAAALKFTVRDSGIGIAPADQQRIFDAFSQADQSVTRRFGGTGLGTTIAKQLVELMGGRIGLESAPGLGTTFWVELEFELQRLPTPSSTQDEFATTLVVLAGWPSAELVPVRQMLKRWGVQFTQAASLKTARRQYEIDNATYRTVFLLAYAKTFLEASHLGQSAADTHQAVSRPPMLVCVAEPLDAASRTQLQKTFDACLELPLQERFLFNALHTVTAREQDQRVTSINEWLARKTRTAKRKLTILVADDHATNRLLITKILDRAGHSAVEAENGQAALEALELGRVDMAILDRNMPEMDGIAATRAIRAMELGGDRRLPIVIVTADATGEARRAAAEAGADLTLPKPLQAVRLLECISSLCERGVSPQLEALEPAGTQSATKSAAAPLNLDTVRELATLSSTGPEFLGRLARTFESDNRKLLDEVDAAVKAKRFVEIPRILHALKGSAGSLGLDQLAQVCTEYRALKDADLRFKGDELARGLRAAFDQGCAALHAQVELLKASESARRSS